MRVADGKKSRADVKCTKFAKGVNQAQLKESDLQIKDGKWTSKIELDNGAIGEFRLTRISPTVYEGNIYLQGQPLPGLRRFEHISSNQLETELASLVNHIKLEITVCEKTIPILEQTFEENNKRSGALSAAFTISAKAQLLAEQTRLNVLRRKLIDAEEMKIRHDQ